MYSHSFVSRLSEAYSELFEHALPEEALSILQAQEHLKDAHPSVGAALDGLHNLWHSSRGHLISRGLVSVAERIDALFWDEMCQQFRTLSLNPHHTIAQIPPAEPTTTIDSLPDYVLGIIFDFAFPTPVARVCKRFNTVKGVLIDLPAAQKLYALGIPELIRSNFDATSAPNAAIDTPKQARRFLTDTGRIIRHLQIHLSQHLLADIGCIAQVACIVSDPQVCLTLINCAIMRDTALLSRISSSDEMNSRKSVEKAFKLSIQTAQQGPLYSRLVKPRKSSGLVTCIPKPLTDIFRTSLQTIELANHAVYGCPNTLFSLHTLTQILILRGAPETHAYCTHPHTESLRPIPADLFALPRLQKLVINDSGQLPKRLPRQLKVAIFRPTHSSECRDCCKTIVNVKK